jgi:hypothetical protein
MISKKLRKGFGIGMTGVLLIGAIVPSQFNIPLPWRPWIFLASILWFFLFATGFFSE